ncbi:DUF294 nucleotidyltransferase-like domain-containing protein [Membranihabitans maritimus]|uniref:DUF294 nucleotidyltransferase-like domain-containing protein n=1 Tax=Membranihabitans maritimus TaxID=2904244 RepID=UPI001F02D81D|nr:DUF294 nucleotidyltransferase-like domain-containing protein [Membranihabitans maritimus]
MTKDSNVLSDRIKDFLVRFPPFSMMTDPNLNLLLNNIKIKYVEKGEVVFHQGAAPNQYFYVIRKGAVKLERMEGGNNILIDVCDEGDVFGIRPLIAEQPYLSTGTAQEESILYAIHTADIRDIMINNPKVGYFLASSFAAGTRNKKEGHNTDGLVFISHNEQLLQEDRLVEIQKLSIGRVPIVCKPGTTVSEAAKIMTDENVGSIVVVNDNFFPRGIVTDSDMRRMVGRGEFDPDKPIQGVMNTPVICLPVGTSYADAQIVMLHNGINHIVMTEDGSDETPVKGVFSESELLAYQGNSPGIIIKQMKKTRNPETLKKIRDKADLLLEKYLYQEVSITFVSDVMTAINDSLLVRAIEISLRKIKSETGESPPVKFSWVAIGSLGRREQILRTDQDHALIFEEVDHENYSMVKSFFLELATKVVEILKICGFKECPAKMMANNPKWCMSIREWKGQFRQWIHSPDNESILHANIFMDYRSVYGDVELTKQLTGYIMNMVHDHRIFLTYLAKYAVETPPPLSFFRNFILEKNGAHKDQFDIKQRAMLPLVDAARVLVLEQKVERMNNTIQRYEKLAEIDNKNEEMYRDAITAYEILLRLRALNGIKNSDNGRYITPNQLNKIQRMLLRNSFKPIGQLQDVLNVRFQLNFFL